VVARFERWVPGARLAGASCACRKKLASTAVLNTKHPQVDNYEISQIGKLSIQKAGIGTAFVGNFIGNFIEFRAPTKDEMGECLNVTCFVRRKKMRVPGRN
jgi:hypothetical protein